MTKMEKEKQVVQLMIELYCKQKHNEKELCSECRQLLEYANNRIELCPYKETKTFCSVCKVHCYREGEREKIKRVMKFSGPRMLIAHPILAIQHIVVTLRSKIYD